MLRRSLRIFGLLLFFTGCAMWAPHISDTKVHAKGMKAEQCAECHLEGKAGAPKAPHQMWQESRKNCWRCHK